MTANDGNKRLQSLADAGLDLAAPAIDPSRFYGQDRAGRRLGRARLQGWAVLPGVLRLAECSVLAGLYGNLGDFRSHMVTARYSFGRGEYR